MIPMIDIMLVLLIIFMISSSIETLQVQQERERVEDSIRPPEDLDQKVPRHKVALMVVRGTTM